MKQIATLQQQVSTLEENQVFNQSKWQEYVTRQQVTSHEKQLSEKNRINELQRELEKYQRTIVDLENKNRNLNFQTLKDMDTLRGDNQKINETNLNLQRTVDLKEEEVRNIKHEVQRLQDEIANLQRVNRDLQSYKENYQLNSNQQAARQQTVIVQKDEGSKNDGLAKSFSEALAREQKYKHKIIRLKQKLKKANEKIMELLPYKLGNNADTDEILKKYRGMNYGLGQDALQRDMPDINYQMPSANYQASSVSYQIPGEGRDVIRELRKKYGFVSYAEGDNVAEHYRHGVDAPKKDEFESQMERARSVADRYEEGPSRTGVEYRTQPLQQTGSRAFVPEESLGSVGYDEIKRFADDEAMKYRFG